jgi:transposase, IS30 family
MRLYKQLSYDERVKLSQMRQAGHGVRWMAHLLGRSASTISRELRRNAAPPGEYWPDTAGRLCSQRRKKVCRIDRHPRLREFVLEKLCYHYWTPEQIAGYLKHRQKALPSVSHETIYAWLYQGAQKKEKLWKFLPRRKGRRGLRTRKGMTQSRIPHRISIHERPQIETKKRKDFGHWEGDLMACRKNSQHMLVLRERKSMLTLSLRLANKKAKTTTQAIRDLMKDIPKEARKTITFDNGGEFAGHHVLTKELGLKTFFCDPYASWQKGGVENTNGRLRRDIPRKTNLYELTEDDFHETIENYNLTPRKKLNWKNPAECFKENLNRVALQT